MDNQETVAPEATTEATAAAPKKARKLKAPTPKPATAKAKAQPKAKAAAKPKAPKVEKPKIATHDFDVSYEGPSTVLNSRVSKTAINFSKFGSLIGAVTTDRDNKSLADLRREFGKNAFKRSNVDAGILRRLGERGFLAHVAGSDVDPQSQFKLTALAFPKSA